MAESNKCSNFPWVISGLAVAGLIAGAVWASQIIKKNALHEEKIAELQQQVGVYKNQLITTLHSIGDQPPQENNVIARIGPVPLRFDDFVYSLKKRGLNQGEVLKNPELLRKTAQPELMKSFLVQVAKKRKISS